MTREGPVAPLGDSEGAGGRPRSKVSVARPKLAAMRAVTDIQRRLAPFEVHADFVPAGDQPAAIDELERRIRAGEQDVVLLLSLIHI